MSWTARIRSVSAALAIGMVMVVGNPDQAAAYTPPRWTSPAQPGDSMAWNCAYWAYDSTVHMCINIRYYGTDAGGPLFYVDSWYESTAPSPTNETAYIKDVIGQGAEWYTDKQTGDSLWVPEGYCRKTLTAPSRNVKIACSTKDSAGQDGPHHCPSGTRFRAVGWYYIAAAESGSYYEARPGLEAFFTC